jgi:ATP/maltotriose-dependent transcriptional regulator MalT
VVARACWRRWTRGNLFLVPLDDRRRWYRYHHLFADVLQARLLDEQPSLVPDLHRRASAWYEQNGERSEAIGHALAAADFKRAANLVELAIPAMRRTRQEARLRSWLEVLPDEVVRARPVLSVYFAVFLGASSVQLPAAASRSLPAVASHAIGFAEPRPGTHSQGIGAYRGKREWSSQFGPAAPQVPG